MAPKPSLLTTLSFAVGSKYGPRSWKWNLTVDAQDIYIAPSMMRRVWKATLHQSGRWHIKSIDPGANAPIIKSHEREMTPGIDPAGIVIVIPDTCLRKASDVEATSEVDRWYPRAPYDGFSEFVVANWHVFRTRPPNDEPPFVNLGFDLQVFRTSSHTAAILGHRSLPPDCPPAQEYAELLNQHLSTQPRPILLNSPERRGVFAFRAVQGPIKLIEYAID